MLKKEVKSDLEHPVTQKTRTPVFCSHKWHQRNKTCKILQQKVYFDFKSHSYRTLHLLLQLSVHYPLQKNWHNVLFVCLFGPIMYGSFNDSKYDSSEYTAGWKDQVSNPGRQIDLASHHVSHTMYVAGYVRGLKANWEVQLNTDINI
jgi:hypothetical protein